MSQYSKMKQSREQWKAKAIKRGQGERDQRKQSARRQAKIAQKTKALSAAEAPLASWRPNCTTSPAGLRSTWSTWLCNCS